MIAHVGELVFIDTVIPVFVDHVVVVHVFVVHVYVFHVFVAHVFVVVHVVTVPVVHPKLQPHHHPPPHPELGNATTFTFLVTFLV